MKTLERIAFILAIIPGMLLSIVCMGLFIILSMFIGLPIAAIKYVITGVSGIDWYVDEGPMDWVLMNNPLFMWEGSMTRRRKGKDRNITVNGEKT